MTVIRSPTNELIKRLRRLQRGAERRRQRRFVVEGLRAIGGFLDAGLRPALLLLREDLEPPPGWPAQDLRRASAAALARASALQTPPGYLAEFPLPEPRPLRPELGGLLLDGVADPGNLGSILRSAAAFGIGQVALLGGADPYAPKAIQASVGALALLRLADIAAEALGELAAGAPLAALVPAGGLRPERWPQGPAWLVIGSEAHGVGEELLARCSVRLSLPMAGGVESLNAAVAAGIACFVRAAAAQSP